MRSFSCAVETKGSTKLKKNSINLKCKLLQIFLTVVDKLLCPQRLITGWSRGAICIPSNTLVCLKPGFWDGTVFILFFFLLFLKNYTEREQWQKQFPLHPLALTGTHGFTHGETGMESNAFTPFRGKASPKDTVVFLTCQRRGKQALIQTNTSAHICKNTPTKWKVDSHDFTRTFSICGILSAKTTI